MSNVTIRKFPVTATDGTEYRVKIEESENFIGEPYVCTTVYYPRKWFGYRKLFSKNYRDGSDVYNVNSPDYVAIAHRILTDYYARIVSDEIKHRERLATVKRKQAALDRFAEWDGKITEVAK